MSRRTPEYLQTFPVFCSCGRTYSEAAWRKLPAAPETQHVSADPEDPERPEAHDLELRQCKCGSHRAAVVKCEHGDSG